MLLAGDIGGTKTDLAVFSVERGPRDPISTARFHSADFPGLEAMTREFLVQTGHSVRWASFDVAGPVVHGRAKLTNLPWVVDSASLRETLGLESVSLLNDLEAIANAVPHLIPSDLITLNEGRPDPDGAIAVIAPGTGLGEAFLTRNGDGFKAHPSEGGHASFAPLDKQQAELLSFLQERFGHVSFERVCSGIGIPNIYDYLAQDGADHETPEVAAQLAQAADRTPIIVQAGLEPGRSARCSATLNLFVAILGAEASNLALKVLATGGVYLAGGIPPRVLPLLQRAAFLEAFRRKGRFTDFVSQVPVHVVMQRVELLGTAIYGLDMARR